MKRKFCAMVLTCMLCVSLAACAGKKDEDDQSTSVPATTAPTAAATAAPTTAPTEAPPEPTPEPVVDATPAKPEAGPGQIVDFEDGGTGFVMVNLSPVKSDPDTVFELVDFNGSKAVKVSGTNGKMLNYLGIDISSLLGDRITEVRSIDVDLALDLTNGTFYACSGNFYLYTGENNAESSMPWSVYLENKNPKTATAVLGGDVSFVTGAKNILVITKETDNAYAAAEASTAFYLDNLIFRDQDGNPIPVNTAAGFDAPDGFGGAATDGGFTSNAIDVMFDLDSGGTNVWQYDLTQLAGMGTLKQVIFQLVGDFSAGGTPQGGGALGINYGADGWYQVDFAIAEDVNLIVIDIPAEYAEQIDYTAGICQVGFWWGSDPIATLTKIEFSDGSAPSKWTENAVNPIFDLDPAGTNVWQYDITGFAGKGPLKQIVFQMVGDFTSAGTVQGGGAVGINYGADGWYQADFVPEGDDGIYVIDIPAEIGEQMDYASGICQIGYWWGSAPIATIVYVDFIF